MEHGGPKVVLVDAEYEALLSFFDASAVEAGLRPRSRLLLVAPLLHCTGWCFAWSAVAVGATSRRTTSTA